MKFGKHLEGRQLELPEYNGHFINYKALKKLIKQLSVPAVSSYSASHDNLTLDETDESIKYQTLQENKASFFFKLERELEKVNEFYLEKEADLRMKFDLLNSRYYGYKTNGKLTSKRSIAYRTIRDGVKKFERDLAQLEQFVELNRTGFSKVLKKWDKRSHSHAKDFYLATVVSVQPIFTRNEVSKWNDAVSALLVELDELNDSEELHTPNFYTSAGQVSRTISRNSDNLDPVTNAPKKARTAKFLKGFSFKPLKYALTPMFITQVLSNIKKEKPIELQMEKYFIPDIDPKVLEKTKLPTKVFERHGFTHVNISDDIPGGCKLISSILKCHGMKEVNPLGKKFDMNDIVKNTGSKRSPDYVLIASKASMAKKFNKCVKDTDKSNKVFVVEWNWCVKSIFNLDIDIEDHEYVIYNK